MTVELTPKQRFALQGIRDQLNLHFPLKLSVQGIIERYSLSQEAAMQVFSIAVLTMHYLARDEGENGLSRETVHRLAGPLVNQSPGQKQLDEVKQGTVHHPLRYSRTNRNRK